MMTSPAFAIDVLNHQRGLASAQADYELPAQQPPTWYSIARRAQVVRRDSGYVAVTERGEVALGATHPTVEWILKQRMFSLGDALARHASIDPAELRSVLGQAARGRRDRRDRNAVRWPFRGECMNRWVVKAACAVLLSGTGLAFSPARAAESTTDALVACANETDDARRLRCFDAVVAGLAPRRPLLRLPRSRRHRARRAAAPPPTPAASVSREDKFGARGDLDRERREELKEITGNGHGSRRQAARRARGHSRQRAGVGRTHRELEDQGEGGRHGEDRVRRAGLLRADRTERPLEQSRARALRASVLSGLAASPDVYLQKVDLARDAALLVQLSESAYRAASFLDDRILASDVKGSWVSLGRVCWRRRERSAHASRCISSSTPATSARRSSVGCSTRAAACCHCASRCRCARSPMHAMCWACRNRC